MPPSPPAILRELAMAALLWQDTKSKYLAAAASKAPEKEVSVARRVHLQAVERLDRATSKFRELQAWLKSPSGRLTKKPIDWKGWVDKVAFVATAVSKATEAPKPSNIIEAKVIDMPTE